LFSHCCSDSDDEEDGSSSAESSSASAVASEDEADETAMSSSLSEPSIEEDDEEDDSSSSIDSASSVDEDDANDIEAPTVAATPAHAKVRKAGSGRAFLDDAESVEVLNSSSIHFASSPSSLVHHQVMQRCAVWIQRSTGIRTKKLPERMLAGYGRGRKGGARAEWCRLCLAVVRFKLGTAVQGAEGLEAGMISLAPGVTLGSLQQFQLPDALRQTGHSSGDNSGSDDDEEGCAASASSSDNEDTDQESSHEEEDELEKRKTRSEFGKVSLELRGLGVKDGIAARQLASNDARPSRFGKPQKRSKAI